MQHKVLHKKKLYTLSNENVKTWDEVYPISQGRVIDNTAFEHEEFDLREFISGFPNEPHIIIDLNNSEYKPYQVRTDHGYGPIEVYYKIIKVEDIPSE